MPLQIGFISKNSHLLIKKKHFELLQIIDLIKEERPPSEIGGKT